MINQNKIVGEFIELWKSKTEQQEFGTKGFQITSKKLSRKQSKELPPVEHDADLSKDNMLWNLKVKKFYMTCLATFEYVRFEGVMLDTFREQNNCYMFSQVFKTKYRLSHTIVSNKPYPILEHVLNGEEATFEIYIKYLKWLSEYYGGIKRGEIPDTRFIPRYITYLALTQMDKFKEKKEVLKGIQYINAPRLRSKLSQHMLKILEKQSAGFYPYYNKWATRLATKLCLIHYQHYSANNVPSRDTDLQKAFQNKFNVSKKEIDEWRIKTRDETPYSRAHRQGGSRKFKGRFQS